MFAMQAYVLIHSVFLVIVENKLPCSILSHFVDVFS